MFYNITYLILQPVDADTSIGSIQTSIHVELQKDSRKFPLDKIGLMILCYVVMLIVTFLKGSEHAPSIIGVEP